MSGADDASKRQLPVYWDSLFGVEGVAGTGTGVRTDSSGDRRAESSGPFPQPLT